MANYITGKGYVDFPNQLIPQGDNPLVAIDAIAANISYTVSGTTSRPSISYVWTPLSSYLGEMRTKIAKQQLFD